MRHKVDGLVAGSAQDRSHRGDANSVDCDMRRIDEVKL
jgi:hypothetical protein